MQQRVIGLQRSLVFASALAATCCWQSRESSLADTSTSATDTSTSSGGNAGSTTTTSTTGSSEALAFPGASGWAARSRGGRGGSIVRVTSLAGFGAGTLSEALTLPDPRIVVFEVGGVIDLNGLNLEIVFPYVTVAGQTAPEPGITVVGGGIQVRTHDVILQHLRVRPGENGRGKQSGFEVDSISTMTGAHQVIVDHCSATWGTDENLSASGERFVGADPETWRAATSHDVTFSNNIIAEGLSNSTHSEGEHSKGGLIHDNVTNMLIIGNLYASNMDRHPLFKGGARGAVVNNYIANPGRWAMMYALNADEWLGKTYQRGQMSIVSNVLRYGPDTPAATPLLRVSGQGPVDVFFDDNLSFDGAGQPAPRLLDTASNTNEVGEPPTSPPDLTTLPASELAAYLRDNVGARPWARDAIDARIVEEALAGEGSIIDSETEVGGYPQHEPTSMVFNDADWDLETMTRKTSD